jgi:hypothetical protein
LRGKLEDNHFLNKTGAQQDDSPDRATFSFIATTPSRKNENIARPVIVDVRQTRARNEI